MSENTIVTAHQSVTRVLKPFRGFEATYQGELRSFPIAMPGSLDFRAGKPGFDPNLLAGVPVPLGTRLTLWFPQPTQAIEGQAVRPYEYRIVWRLRTPVDVQIAQQQTGTPNNPDGLSFHLPSAAPGIPNTAVAPPTRVLIPAALSSIAYEQAEPVTTFTDGVTNLRGERLLVEGALYGLGGGPIIPGGAAIAADRGWVGQGYLPSLPDFDGSYGAPFYMPYQTDAFGDEFIILVNRQSDEIGATWDFTPGGPDGQFSQFYGTNGGAREPIPALGILVITGSGAS